MSQTPGELIRQHRLERGLSLGQLASTVSTTVADVRRWERDEEVPSEDQIATLSEALRLADEATVVLVEAHVAALSVAEEEPGERAGPERGTESPTELVSAATGVSLTSVSQPDPVEDPTASSPAVATADAAPAEDEERLVSPPPPRTKVGRPVAEPEPASHPVPLRYPESAPAGVAVEIAAPEPNPWNPLRYLYDPEKPWLYWVRAALTVIVLLVLVNILFDSISELFDKIGEVFDSIEPIEPVEGEIGEAELES